LLPVLLAFALLSSASATADAAADARYAGREDVRQFIAEMVDRHGFAGKELRKLFSQARFQPTIIKAITPPTEPRAKSWQAYRALFLTPQRIEAGIEFRERHREALSRAVELYGVPEEIIVAIIGVETVYGRNTGNYRVIDALTTLAFDYPPRAEFFRTELENYLLFARDAGIDTLSLRGSYAGAIGIPQFMPGSYRRYAVDLDGDGKQDLSGSFADAIGSVANFPASPRLGDGPAGGFCRAGAGRKLPQSGRRRHQADLQLRRSGGFRRQRGGRDQCGCALRLDRTRDAGRGEPVSGGSHQFLRADALQSLQPVRRRRAGTGTGGEIG